MTHPDATSCFRQTDFMRRCGAIGVLLTLGLLMDPSSVAIASDYAVAIRREGLSNSRAYTFADDLTLNVGARLMGSPNMARAYDWAQHRLDDLQIENRREPIGEFGLSWREVGVSLSVSSPDRTALTARAAPWSVASRDAPEGLASTVSLSSQADFVRYRGRLADRFVLLGPALQTASSFTPAAIRWSDDAVDSGAANAAVRAYYARRPQRGRDRAEEAAFSAAVRVFLEGEHVKAVIVPDAPDPGGVPGGLTVDNRYFPMMWRPEMRPTFPVAVLDASEFSRIWRLAEQGQMVRLNAEIDTETLGEAEQGYNIVGEIRGSDPSLRSEIVLLGAHLDSWHVGTGAVDNAAGVAVSLEALRLLKSAGFAPKRTIRLVLYGGEEQGLLGAKSHVAQFVRDMEETGPRQGETLVVAYNIDGGSGRIRGVYTGSDAQLAACHRAWIAPLRDLGVREVYEEPDWPADQSAFTDAGLPGVSFLQDPLDYDSLAHHRTLDTIERLNSDDLAQAATVMALLVGKAAEDSGGGGCQATSR